VRVFIRAPSFEHLALRHELALKESLTSTRMFVWLSRKSCEAGEMTYDS